MTRGCISFVLLGMPLGIRAHRRESSIGVAMSLLLIFAFYLFIIIADSFSRTPGIRPDLIVWMPVVISVALGSYLVQRANH